MLVINRSLYKVIGCTYYTEEIQYMFTHRIASISSSFSANRFSASWRKLASSADRRWARCSSALRPCNPQHQLVSNTWHEDQLIYLCCILKEVIHNSREDYNSGIVINVVVSFKITFWFINMFENTTVILRLIVLVFFYLNYSLLPSLPPPISLLLVCLCELSSDCVFQDLLSYTKVWVELMDVCIWESSVCYMQYKGNVGQNV